MSEISDPALRLSHVTKRYGAFTAVDDLSFEVGRGEIFGFLGPNGAGKTTTLRMALDIIPPTEGRIAVLGAASATKVRARIGYLPEERGLYRKMRAAESIAYFARLRGVPAAAATARANALLEEFDLGKFARSKVEALSKGMAQKVQLLATIAHEPEFLILDEPFSGLDPLNQSVLEALVLRLNKEGRTIIFSTHVMAHAERLCERFLILANGKKRFEGTLAEARGLSAPSLILRAKGDVAAALGGTTAIAGIARKGSADGDFADWRVELVRGADPQAVVRAAFAAGLDLARFEEAGVSLHDIFVAIVGAASEPQS